MILTGLYYAKFIHFLAFLILSDHLYSRLILNFYLKKTLSALQCEWYKSHKSAIRHMQCRQEALTMRCGITSRHCPEAVARCWQEVRLLLAGIAGILGKAGVSPGQGRRGLVRGWDPVVASTTTSGLEIVQKGAPEGC